MAYKLVGVTVIKWHKILSYAGSDAIKQLPKYINGVKLTKLTKERAPLKIEYKIYLIVKYT
jgi:hypothetical protein